MEYYSSREERLQNSSNEVKKSYENRNGKGFLKKNPHLKMMLIDLSIIILFALIIVPVFLRIASTIKINEFNVTSKAFIFDEKLLVTVKIEKTKLKKNIDEELGELNIILKKSNQEQIGSKSILLTKETKKEYINFTFPFSNDLENIIINLSLNDYEKEYTVKIENQ